MTVLLLADGGFQADRFLSDFQDFTNPLHRHIHLGRDFLRGGVVAQFLEELAGHPDDLVDSFHHMNRDADGPGLVGDGTSDGLADPPGGVSGELEALSEVKLLHSFDKTQITLLNQVQELHPTAHIPLGDRDHKTQVGLSQPLLGPLPLLDGLSQLHPDLVGDILTSFL